METIVSTQLISGTGKRDSIVGKNAHKNVDIITTTNRSSSTDSANSRDANNQVEASRNDAEKLILRHHHAGTGATRSRKPREGVVDGQVDRDAVEESTSGGKSDEWEEAPWWRVSEDPGRISYPKSAVFSRRERTGTGNQGDKVDDEAAYCVAMGLSGSDLEAYPRQHSSNDMVKSGRGVEWVSNQGGEASEDEEELSVSDVSSLSMGSALGSHLSTSVLGASSSSVCDSSDSKQNATVGLGGASLAVEDRDFAASVDMMALWYGVAGSASTISKASVSESSMSSHEASSSASGGRSGVSASVEDFDSDGDSISSLSSLSSFSVQSGVCKVASPRLIENIPVASMTGTVDESYLRLGSTSSGYPRYWTEQEYVEARGPRTGQAELDPHFTRKRFGRDERMNACNRLKKRLYPQEQVRARSTVTKHTHVDESNELFLKFDELRGIFEEHVPRRPSFFLDVGCGTSSICKEMVLRGYNHMYGIDIAPSKIQLQRDRCSELQQFVRFHEMDATAMQFPDDFFDCIFSKAILDLVASNYIYESSIDGNCGELHQILEEIRRCLKPGGVWIVVSCHSARSPRAEDDGSFSEKLSKPWWQWEGVSEFLRAHFDQVKVYHAGTPLVRDRRRVKPFVVILYRRKETGRQRLARLHRDQEEEKQMQRDFDVKTKWLLEKHRWRTEAESIVMESRQMVGEDVLSRYSTSVFSYEIAKEAREVIREDIYKRVLEADRAAMGDEDVLSTAMRSEYLDMLQFVSRTLSELANSAVAHGDAQSGMSSNPSIAKGFPSEAASISLDPSLLDGEVPPIVDRRRATTSGSTSSDTDVNESAAQSNEQHQASESVVDVINPRENGETAIHGTERGCTDELGLLADDSRHVQAICSRVMEHIVQVLANGYDAHGT